MPESPTKRPSRSRSPASRPKASGGGFRWKDDRRKNEERRRDRSPRRRRSRDRDQDRRRDRDGDRARDQDRGRDRERGRDRDRPRDSRRDQESKDGEAKDDRKEERKPKKDKKESKPKAPPVASNQELIVVHCNSRLGQKTSVPCLGSDTIGQLKVMIAARIGREPGQIRLQRQGERPFKDQLSLEDYGISNGVQLDLEVDTRD